MRKLNYVGKQIGKLLIKKEVEPAKYRSGQILRQFIVKCLVCKKESVKIITSIKPFNTSCGCIKPGFIRSNPNAKPIIATQRDTNNHKIFLYQQDCCRQLDLSRQGVNKCINDKQTRVGDYNISFF